MNIVLFSTLVSLATATLWLFIVYRMDKHEKEPIWLLVKVFLAGFLLSFVAGIINSINKEMFGVVGSHILVGFVEEGVKFLAVWWVVFGREEFDEPIDGVVYASAAALGFAFSENIDYNLLIITSLKEEATAALMMRSFMPLLHVLLASIWGYGLGYYKQYIGGKMMVLGMWFLAAVLHSAYDLTVGSVSYVMLATFAVLGLVFIYRMKHLNRISPKNSRRLISCPYCAKKIKENSLYCRYCGKHIFLLTSEIDLYCRHCRSPVREDWKFCVYCGSQI